MPIEWRETSDRTVAVIRYLEDHGARRTGGFQIPQDKFAAALGIPRRALVEILKMLETYGVLHVRRTTVGNAILAQRDYNFYSLKTTTEKWRDELGPRLAAARAEKVKVRKQAVAAETQRKKQAAIERAAEVVVERVVKARGGIPLAPQARRPESPVLDEATIDALAADYGDVTDDELVGW